KVYMVYRRSPAEMTAFDYEYELAKNDGIDFVWQATPLRIAGPGRVEALECIRTERSTKDAGGRYSYPPVPGTEFTLEVGMVIKALGQKRKLDFLKQIPNLELQHGRVVVDPPTMRTRNPRYFAGGDCVNGGGEVVEAVAHGKRAAGGIHQMLEATKGRRA